MSKPTFDGLVRSNFWKGRQRLNRLYRWIANVVRPKIDGPYYAKPTPKTILTGAIFERRPRQGGSRTDIILSRGVPLLENPPTCGGTGRAAAHHAGLCRHRAARPCGGRSAG